MNQTESGNFICEDGFFWRLVQLLIVCHLNAVMIFLISGSFVLSSICSHNDMVG